MKPMGEPRAHYWRVVKMAQRCDVDLQAALDQGDLSKEDWAHMVTDCRKCPKVGACDATLETREHRDTAPGYCMNKSVFADLK